MADRNFIGRTFDWLRGLLDGRIEAGSGWVLTCQLCPGFVTDDIGAAQAHVRREHDVSWAAVVQPCGPMRVDDEHGRRFDYILADGRVWLRARKGTP